MLAKNSIQTGIKNGGHIQITIKEGAIKEDHVHLYLSVPPKHSPAHVMKILKGKSAEYIAEYIKEGIS